MATRAREARRPPQKSRPKHPPHTKPSIFRAKHNDRTHGLDSQALEPISRKLLTLTTTRSTMFGTFIQRCKFLSSKWIFVRKLQEAAAFFVWEPKEFGWVSANSRLPRAFQVGFLHLNALQFVISAWNHLPSTITRRQEVRLESCITTSPRQPTTH